MPHFPEVCEVTAIEFYGDATPEARAALNGLGARSYATLLAL
jgi:hypothetical protein